MFPPRQKKKLLLMPRDQRSRRNLDTALFADRAALPGKAERLSLPLVDPTAFRGNASNGPLLRRLRYGGGQHLSVRLAGDRGVKISNSRVIPSMRRTWLIGPKFIRERGAFAHPFR